MADLSGADFRGANLTSADLHPLETRPGPGTLSTLMRNVLKSCDFSGATLKDANLNRAVLTFSRFVGADLRGADLSDTDLSKTDFAGADLAGADLSRADLYGANLVGARGLDTVKGLDTVANLDKATQSSLELHPHAAVGCKRRSRDNRLRIGEEVGAKTGRSGCSIRVVEV